MNLFNQVLNSKKVGWLITIIGIYFTGFPPEDKNQQDECK